ncbi:CLUMA_CG002880, isoform A [Clunio marinus]|uniref:CLUMA_CG002880, isoform A n=1 Tax=Clunio marinus TaxID=568069 RepID=A0A1J1HSE6_9DIPT|nr:CLUMA_CG002880, isoform A [Clunio marinus]
MHQKMLINLAAFLFLFAQLIKGSEQQQQPQQQKPPTELQKQLGLLQMQLGQFIQMISNLLKQLTGMDLNTIIMLFPGKAEAFQGFQKALGALFTTLGQLG